MLQKRFEDSQRLLVESSRVLAASFELRSTLPTVATMMATWFRGYCLIDLIVDDRLERVAAAHCDPDNQALMEEMPWLSDGARGGERAGLHRGARGEPAEGRVSGDRFPRAADAAQRDASTRTFFRTCLIAFARVTGRRRAASGGSVWAWRSFAISPSCHGGTVTAHSDGEGHGATFTLSLPAGSAAARLVDAPEAASAG